MGWQSHTAGLLDTSGKVPTVAGSETALNFYTWDRLSLFTQGYVEALFASVCPDEDGSRALRQPIFSDLAPETLARIIAECEAVTKRIGDRLLPVMFGGTFWMQRATGFPHVGAEDRGWCVAHFPPLTVQIGDDGKVRFSA